LLAEDSDLAVLLNPDKATRSRHAEEPDVQKLKRGSTSWSSALYSRAKHLSQTSSVHSGASSHSQSAEDLAGPLRSTDKATCRRHSEEPDGQKLSPGSTSSGPETDLTSGLASQRHNSSILQSVRRRGSMMLTAADLNDAVSSGSAFYVSQVMARQASKHKVARAKPCPRSPHSRQSTQSNQLAGTRVQVGIGQALHLGLFSVFSAISSLLGLLVSVQTYVSHNIMYIDM